MPVSISQRRQAELAKLAKRGKLKAEDVVAFAANPRTALHSAFEWDDTVAAHGYRLWQARQLIVTVRITPYAGAEEVQAWVSMRDDRTDVGGGYRQIVEVLSDKELRAKLLEEALADLEIWQRKYAQLQELADVFAASQKAQKMRKAA